MARVIISKSPDKLLALAKRVLDKHTADGASSLLNNLRDYSWTEHGSKVAAAEALQAQAKEMERELEKVYQNRDALLAPVEQTVRASAKLLSSIYKKSPKNLGDWGFEVNDTTTKKTDTNEQ